MDGSLLIEVTHYSICIWIREGIVFKNEHLFNILLNFPHCVVVI